MSAQHTEPTLPQLLKSQEHADFIIRTKTRDFHVHKDFKEAHNGIVEVEERTEVIEAVLELVYESPRSFIPSREDNSEATEQKRTLSNLLLAVDYQVAVDKYLVSGVSGYEEDLPATTLLFINHIAHDSATRFYELVQAAVQIFRTDLKIDFVARIAVLMNLATYMTEIMKTSEAWTLLLEHGRLLKAVVEAAMVETTFQARSGGEILEEHREEFWDGLIDATCEYMGSERDESPDREQVQSRLAKLYAKIGA